MNVCSCVICCNHFLSTSFQIELICKCGCKLLQSNSTDIYNEKVLSFAFSFIDLIRWVNFTRDAVQLTQEEQGIQNDSLFGQLCAKEHYVIST